MDPIRCKFFQNLNTNSEYIVYIIHVIWINRFQGIICTRKVMMIFGKCVHTVSIIRRNLVRAAKSRLRGYHGGKEKVKKRICIYICIVRSFYFQINQNGIPDTKGNKFILRYRSVDPCSFPFFFSFFSDILLNVFGEKDRCNDEDFSRPIS